MRLLGDLTLVELCRKSSPLHIRLATAMAAKCFAGLGATVVRIEPPRHDPLRDVQPLLSDGNSALFHFLSTDVSILSPADDAEHTAALHSLIARGLAGAIIAENDSAHALLKDGGVPTVRIATWPASLGEEWASRRVEEFQVMALGGLLDMIGDPDREPLRIAGHQVSYAAGLAAFTAGMAAILQREADGRAMHARVSLVETATWINWKAVAGEVAGFPVSRQGMNAEYQVLPCKDGWIAFVYTPSQYDRVSAMLGDPEAEDPRFATRAGRAANVKGLMTIARRWLSSRTREQVYAAARQHGVPLGPVYEPTELLNDEQYLARNFLAYVMTNDGTPRCIPTLPITLDGQRFPIVPPKSVTVADLLGKMI